MAIYAQIWLSVHSSGFVGLARAAAEELTAGSARFACDRGG